MPLDALIMQCAPGVSPQTMAAIIQVESGGNPWAIGDNTLGRPYKPTPTSYQEAVTVANYLLSIGHNIDIGAAQINSKNLRMLNLSVEQILDPCTNIFAGSKILRGFYLKSVNLYGEGQQSLYHALSGYNTGSLYAGSQYVQKIIAAAYRGLATTASPLAPRPTPYRVTWSENRQVSRQLLVDNSQDSQIITK